MTSQGEWFAELMYCKCEFLLYSPLFRLRNTHISSLVPCLNVGLLPGVGTREVIGINGFRVASMTKTVIKEDVRGTVHTAQESVCQNYSGDLNGVVFYMFVHANNVFQWLS